MANILIINEKPSVSREFAHALKVSVQEKNNGYIEGYSDLFGCTIWITWCVGHLVTLSYPEKYDEKYKKWNLDDLPFLPEEYKYEVIGDVKSQFSVVKKLLNSVGQSENDRNELSALKMVSSPTIFYAGDAAREGVYIQALVRQEAGRNKNAAERVVWIDSQTDEEILRGIREAKPYEHYLPIISSGYERGIEDYSSGINFSRALTLKYSQLANYAADTKGYRPLAVGRVMTCVLGMIVEREKEITNFKPTRFFKIKNHIPYYNYDVVGEWKAEEGSPVFNDPAIYENTGFLKEEDAKNFIKQLPGQIKIETVEKKMEKKHAPYLFNLAELQNECSKKFKISPDKTLEVAQSLYEKKLTTYPRTDARVLSSAIAKEIEKNVTGIQELDDYASYCETIIGNGWTQNIEKSRYVNDAKISDHYAIIPTGVGFDALEALTKLEQDVYDLIVRRFLSIFYPPAEYYKVKVTEKAGIETFYASGKLLNKPGYLKVAGSEDSENESKDADIAMALGSLKEGAVYPSTYEIKDGTTNPPKRYTSGSIILAMEGAGKLIDEEELRVQLKDCGIGTSATRSETIKKLIKLEYISLNQKTQVLSPLPLGYIVYEIVYLTIPALLNPKITASWEKGLEQIVNGTITGQIYRDKLRSYVYKETEKIKGEDLNDKIKKNISQYAKNKNYDEMKDSNTPDILSVPCPICNGELKTTKYGCICSNYNREDPAAGCNFGIGQIAGVTLSQKEMETLIGKGTLPEKTGFLSKSKKKFSAGLKFSICETEAGVKEKKIEFVFPERKPDVQSNLNCPKCSSKLMKNEWNYYCECGYKISHTVAGKKLEDKHMRILVEMGTTPLIKGFKSSKGKRFDAKLSADIDGKITFQFNNSR